MLKKEFKEWLESKGGLEVVGVTGNAATCPLASWRRECGDPCPNVKDSKWTTYFRPHAVWKPLPD